MKARFSVLLLFLLAALAAGMLLSRKPEPVQPPPVPPTGCEAEGLLCRAEEGLVSGGDAGRILEDLLASFRVRSACRATDHEHAPVLYRMYGLLLPDPQRSAFLASLPPEARSDRRDVVIRKYLLELGTPWVVEVLRAYRHHDEARLAELSQAARLPERLARYEEHVRSCRRFHGGATGPTTVLHFLASGFYDEARSQTLARASLDLYESLGLSWRGRTVCDMGTALGAPLTFYEAAVGPEGRVYAVDINPYPLDFVRFLVEQGELVRTTVVLGEEDDGKLPPAAVDVILLTGVHMGSGLKEHYEKSTRPWLVSLARALRPGGHLLVDEGEPFTRKEILWAFAPTHLELVKWSEGPIEIEGASYGAPHQIFAVFRKG